MGITLKSNSADARRTANFAVYATVYRASIAAAYPGAVLGSPWPSIISSPVLSARQANVTLPVCDEASLKVMVFAMTNRWYAYFSLALEGPASN